MGMTFDKANPKDAYTLPNIDWMMDGVVDHDVLSFLDTYLGYNQVPTAETNKLKTEFIIKEAK